MAALFTLLLLLAPDQEADKTEAVAQHLREGETEEALAILKEMAALDGDHVEAVALVRLVRDPRYKKPPEVMEAIFLAEKGIGSRQATRHLLGLLDHSELKKDPVVRIGVCRALEGSGDPAGISELMSLLYDRDDRVIAAAADALAVHRHAREEVRKDIFERVMNVYVATWNVKNSVDPGQRVEKARAERKWEVVAKPMERCLQLISNVTQEDPPAWRRWWNKNKNRRWTAPPGDG